MSKEKWTPTKGDWVRAYGRSDCGRCWSNGDKYRVIEAGIKPSRVPYVMLMHRDDSKATYEFHPKQCRRLVKRKPEYYEMRHCTEFCNHNDVFVAGSEVGPVCAHCQVFRVKRVGEKK